MSDTATQTPLEESQERAAESFPAWLIPRLLGVQNLARTFSLYQQKARDDHALEMKALGGEPGMGGEEDMGDISVAGDTTTIQHIYPSESKPAEAGKEAPSAVRKLLPLATAALLGAGGLWVFDNWNSFEWPGVPDASYEVRFYNADGELIEVPRHQTQGAQE